MYWDEKELDTQFTPNVYFWIPNSEILAKALCPNMINFDGVNFSEHCSGKVMFLLMLSVFHQIFDWSITRIKAK